MSIDFPNNPTQGQEFTPPGSSVTFVYLAPRWTVQPANVTGPQGPPGPQGVTGIGINLKGTVANAAALPGGAVEDDAYVANDTGDLWVWNQGAWVNIGLIQGPPGPQGIPGAKGSQGTQGTPGATGAAGAAGPAGPTGAQGSAGVQGPAGAAGATGATGAQGAQGVPGPTGPAGPAGPAGPVGSAAIFPAGIVMPFAGATAPAGFLLCYGQAISRSTYAVLFAAIGVAYGGGDGTNTFNVPDLRGRTVAGKDNMGGTAANRLTNSGVGNSGINGSLVGAVGGVDRLGITAAQMPSHAHTATDSGHGHSVWDPGHYHSTTGLAQGRSAAGEYTSRTAGGYNERICVWPGTTTVNTPTSDYKYTNISIYNGNAVITVAAAGGSEAHPIVQPTAIVNYIIATGVAA